MVLHRETLPYEIRRTACELYAGKTGFTQEEMKALFTEEIRKTVEPPSYPPDEANFWVSLGVVMTHMQFEQQLQPDPFRTRAEAFEYWLSLLPLWKQKELLLELCRKSDFPMSRGHPSLQRRNQLTAMLTNFAIGSHVSSVLQRLGSIYVMNTWQKAIARCADGDPQGAITIARTLLESTSKHILDARGISYNENAELPKLYSLVAQELKIAPNRQSEQALRQIFGGCHSVIDGLASLRNQLSDAHGKGRANMEPSPYLAALAVNLAGAVAIFLVQVWEADPRSYNGRVLGH